MITPALLRERHRRAPFAPNHPAFRVLACLLPKSICLSGPMSADLHAGRSTDLASCSRTAQKQTANTIHCTCYVCGRGQSPAGLRLAPGSRSDTSRLVRLTQRHRRDSKQDRCPPSKAAYLGFAAARSTERSAMKWRHRTSNVAAENGDVFRRHRHVGRVPNPGRRATSIALPPNRIDRLPGGWHRDKFPRSSNQL
jgi:hypothetical protein